MAEPGTDSYIYNTLKLWPSMSDLWVRVTVIERRFWDFTDVTPADEETNGTMDKVKSVKRNVSQLFSW